MIHKTNKLFNQFLTIINTKTNIYVWTQFYEWLEELPCSGNTTVYAKRIILWFQNCSIDVETVSIERIKTIHQNWLKYNNSVNGSSITTYEKFEVFMEPKDALIFYKEYVKNKTHKLITLDRSRDTRSLSACKMKHGERGAEIYEKIREKSRKASKRCSEYWINQGLTLSEANCAVSEYQRHAALDRFIKRYGEEEGIIRWRQRQEKWLQTLNNKSSEEKALINFKKNNFNIHAVMLRGFSEDEARVLVEKNFLRAHRFVSDECLNFISQNIHLNPSDENMYGASGEYAILSNNKYYLYDLTIVNKKIIFEYHGQAFHPNPNILNADEWSQWIMPFNNFSADEKYAFDQHKRSIAINEGFQYFEIFSNDTPDQKQTVIDALNFAINRS